MTDRGPDITGPEAPGGDDPDLAAAEQVLGLTDGAARLAAAERARADPAFAARLDAWERRFSPLIADVAPVRPPDAVWDRIAASIATPSPTSTADGGAVIAFPARRRWLESLTLWRAAAAVSTLAAACLALVLMIPSKPATPPAQQIATLTTPGGRVLYVATLDPARRTVTVAPVGDATAPDRSPELWIIPAGGKPRPVGLLPPARALSLPTSSAVVGDATPKAVLAVSLEPLGGSPTGAPTGPVIATGTLTSI